MLLLLLLLLLVFITIVAIIIISFYYLFYYLFNISFFWGGTIYQLNEVYGKNVQERVCRTSLFSIFILKRIRKEAHLLFLGGLCLLAEREPFVRLRVMIFWMAWFFSATARSTPYIINFGSRGLVALASGKGKTSFWRVSCIGSIVVNWKSRARHFHLL